MLNRRLVWFLERHNHISSAQCGFWQGRSTRDHLARADNYVQEGFLLRQHVIAVFLDIERAYDRVSRRKILAALHKWGFRVNLPTFIQNFLSDRVFKVRIGNTLSRFYAQEN
jgi:uncharacterized protein YcgL (UPF0745 family)